MKSRLSRYELLIDKEISGIISLKEQATLDKAKAKYPEVHQLWKEQRKLFSGKEMQRQLNEKSVPPSVSKAAPGKRGKKPPLILMAGILAGIVGIVGILSIPFITKKNSPESNTVELRLENGEKFDLSQDGEMQAGNISFKNQHGLLTYSFNTTTALESPFSFNTVSGSALLYVPPGKKHQITLSDGTEITMNAASTVRFPTSFNNSPTREIFITGEAYLKVAKDANHAFIVKTAEGEVLVLGTEFNINSYNEGKPEVALVEGKVKFKASKDSVVLEPGYAAIHTDKGMQIQKFDEEILKWREGILILKNKPMEEVIQDIRRLFVREVVLDSPFKAKRLLSGKLFSNQSIESNLDLLKGPGGFQYTIDENSVIHIN